MVAVRKDRICRPDGARDAKSRSDAMTIARHFNAGYVWKYDLKSRRLLRYLRNRLLLAGSLQLVKKQDFSFKTFLRVRGVDHVEQKLVITRLLEFEPVWGIRFHGTGPEVSTNGAGIGLPRPGCAHGLANFLNRSTSAQMDDFHRAVSHILRRSLQTGRPVSDGGKIKFPPFFFGKISAISKCAFRRHRQSQCAQSVFDLTVQAAPERIRFNDDERVLCLNIGHDDAN